jgi:hypothetical protein
MPCAKELYQQANQLPPLEKLRLAELLLADLDTPDPEIDTIWRDEAQKKMASLLCRGVEDSEL